MNWKLVGVVSLCFLMFVIGLLVGGIDWSWMKGSHNSEVAFWTMLGGWVSGVATLAAVVVSMTVAYQASQGNVEKIEISVEPLRNEFGIGDRVFCVIKVKNLKPLDTPLMKLILQVDGVSADLTVAGLQQKNLPYTLHQQGELWKFETNLTPSIGWMSIFTTLSPERPSKFKKCYLIVETAMGQHRIKVNKELITKLTELDAKIRGLKDENKIAK
ncbi:hypothetical protein [Enterobacter asburiae]|uniref:hypothetical protein n=1 Tax=Enterobacter asburiae TaxID=61645 RepID=UPI00207664DE|nr:hypothetical protein [Enterobacter asburiae]MCM7565641.1 hypothetical protein [Enterobacter asburiae]